MSDDQDDGEHEGGIAWKVYSGLAAVVAGFVAKKLVTLVWTKATGKEPPKNPEHPDVTWPEAVGWAVFSGVVAALARLLATRKAAQMWHRASGSLPAELSQ